MRDKETLAWIYVNSKAQLFPFLVLILTNILLAGCGILFALAARSVIDEAASGAGSALIMKEIALFIVIVLQFLLRILSRVLSVRIQSSLETGYRATLLQQLLSKEYVNVTQYHSGELINRLTSDITVVSEGVTSILPDFAGLLTRVLGALAVLYILNRSITLVFLISGLLLFLTAGYFRNKLKYLHKEVQKKDGMVRSFMQELLESLMIVKVFDAEDKMEAKTAELQQEYYRAKLKRSRVSILANTGFSLLFSLGYLYALIRCTLGLMTATISFGTLTAILQLVGQTQLPLAGLSGLLPKAYGVISSAERIMELERLPEEGKKKKQDINIAAIYRNMCSINFKEVSFRYDRDYIISNADFTINKGDFLVISGLSGIGKSTLFKLLLGLYTPTSGAIYISLSNQEAMPIDKDIRSLFAYVPQGNLLLSGTIREAISFAHEKASDKEIMEAAEVGCAAEFIRSLPHGLDTVIGERGYGLSEGQIQRIAIARAILCGAPILLLDEATSALDEDTEERLLKNIQQLEDRTCLIISHKKAAFSLCNKEIRIQDARIQVIERRNHSEDQTA
jgi:ATP-binding cassette subfamily B protein